MLRSTRRLLPMAFALASSLTVAPVTAAGADDPWRRLLHGLRRSQGKALRNHSARS